MNELLWLAMLLANFIFIILAYRIFGKKGLIFWIPISTIVANIQVIQPVEIFGFASTLGNIVYATSFLITDILSENYGKKDANQAVWIGFFSLLVTTVLMNLALFFEPLSGDQFAMDAHNALTTIFSVMPRIALASMMAYLISQKHDIWAYHFWRKQFPGSRNIWIRNNLSTMISQLMDSAIFTIIAFYGSYPTNILFEIFATTFVLKWIVAVADTPFVYWASYMKRNNKIMDHSEI